MVENHGVAEDQCGGDRRRDPCRHRRCVGHQSGARDHQHQRPQDAVFLHRHRVDEIAVVDEGDRRVILGGEQQAHLDPQQQDLGAGEDPGIDVAPPAQHHPDQSRGRRPHQQRRRGDVGGRRVVAGLERREHDVEQEEEPRQGAQIALADRPPAADGGGFVDRRGGQFDDVVVGTVG